MVVSLRTCQHRSETGRACGAAPLREGGYCLMHDPDHAAEVQEARRLGGLRRKREATLSGAYEFQSLVTVGDIRRLLEISVLDTLALDNGVARNRTLAYLAQVATKLLEVGEIEDRLQALESFNRRRGSD